MSPVNDLRCGGVLWEQDFETEYDEDSGFPIRQPTRLPPPPPPPLIPAAPTMADYERGVWHFAGYSERIGALSYLRELTIAGLAAGTISKHDLLYRVRPAAVAVSVLSEREVARDGAVVAAVIRSVADRNPARWAFLIDLVGFWNGSLASLLAGRDDSAAQDCPSVDPAGRRVWTGHLWRPANILLAMAPAEGVRQFLTAGSDSTALRRASIAELMPGFMPLSRLLVEHTVNQQGGARARANLAGNAFAPDPVLTELLRWEAEPEIDAAIRRHDFAGGAVRWRAFCAVRTWEPARPTVRPRFGNDASLRKSLKKLLEHGQQQFLDMLAVACDGATADDAAFIHTLIKFAGDTLRPEARLAALAMLAGVSGPEAVWSLELARVGSLASLSPAVRASMAEGSAAPLAAAAREEPFRDPNAAVSAAAAELRREEALDSPLPWLD